MNHLEVKVFTGEIVSPDHTVTVLIAKHPFATRTHRFNVQAGSSLHDLVEDCFPTRGTAPVVCYIVNDEHEDIIPAEWWPRIRPKAGTTVVFRAVAEGKYAKSLALIGVAILAIVAAVFLPVLIPELSILGLSAAASASLIGGAISVAGSLAVQALFPVAKKKLENTSTEAATNVFSISGAQNTARPFEAVPVVLGRHKLSPPYAAQAYTEYVGNDQYLTMMFCVGYGPLGHFNYKIGETDTGQFTFSNFEARAGWPGDSPISFYPYATHQEDFSIKLLNTVNNIRTTEDDIDQIGIDFIAPEGIFQFYPDTNIYGSIPISFSVYYRLLPGGGWQLFSQTLYPFTFGKNALRQGYAWQVGTRGQYEVMITRNYSDSDDTNVKDDVYWSALRSTRYENPIHFDVPLSIVAMKIKASDQLSGAVNTFNLEAQSVGLRFNGTAWINDYTYSNPADLFRHVLQGPANKQPVPDSRLDFVAIQAWWQFCANHGFTYNAVVESKRSVYEVISEICAAGRAVPTWKDGRWSVIWDAFDSPIVQHFTPRNSREFKGDRVYKQMPHGFRIRFIDGTNGYVQDEMIVYDDGYGPSNATLFEAVEFPGVTDPDLVYKHGRYHIAQVRLRPEVYSLTVDIEHMRCTRGDRVRVLHDIAMIGQIAGRVQDVTGQTITLDEKIGMEIGKEYGCRFRLASGDSILRYVASHEGESNTFTLTGTGPVPEVGDLAMFGERDRESAIFRIFKIEHQNDFEAKLTLVDDAPEIINADQGPIPQFRTHISDPVDPYSFPPRNLNVSEIIVGSGDTASAFVRFSWTPARAANVVSYEAQIRDETHPDLGWYDNQTVSAPQQFTDYNHILLGTYSFRVRAKFEDKTASSWTELNSKDITAPHLTSPLADVQNVRTAYVDGVTAIRWDQITDFRQVLYEIRRGDTWESALLMGTFAQAPFAAHGLGIYWIAAVTRPIQGVVVYSPNPVELIITGSRLVDNVLASWDEKATGWTGLFSGTAATSGDVIRTGGTAPFLEEPNFLGIPSLFFSGGTGNGNYYMPDAHTVDCGSIVRANVTIDYNGTGDADAGGTGPIEVFLVDDLGNTILDSSGNPLTTISEGGTGVRSFLDITDFLGAPDFLGAASARYVDIYPLIGTKDGIADAWFWQRWQPGTYVGRYFTGAMVLKVLSPQVAAYCMKFNFTVDVPDRIERYTNLAVPAGGLSIIFKPEGSATSAPFHGGPSGALVPNIQVTILNAAINDVATVTVKTLAGCTIQITNFGTGVARSVDLVVQGY